MWIVSSAWECPVGYYGGLGAVVSRLLPALSRLGNVVHVCTEGSRRATYRFCNALVVPWSETVPGRGGVVGASESLVLSEGCFRLGVGADVVVAHDHHTSPCVVALSEHGVRTVFFFHITAVSEFEVLAVRSATKVVANSRKTASIIASATGREPEVVYLPSPLRVVERRRGFRRRRNRLVVFGRFEWFKDPSWFFDHLDRLWRRGAEFTVVVAGRGAELLRDRAHYPWLDVRGALDERSKIELLADSDLLVYPARFDPYGLSVLESISLGTPAFVSSGAGVSEVLPAGVFDPEKPDEAVEALNQLIGDPVALGELLAKQRESLAFRRKWADVATELIR